MRGWRFWLGLGVGIAALAYFSRDLDLKAFVSSWGKINWWWYSGGILLFCFSFWLRCPRWKLLVEGLGPVSFGLLTQAFFVGMLVNRLFPARLGEVARCIILKRRGGLPFSGLLATVAVEKSFDGPALFSVLLLGFASLPTDSLPEPLGSLFAHHHKEILLGALGVPLALGVISLVLPLMEKRLGKVGGILGSRFVRKTMQSVSDGISVFRSAGQSARMIGWTVVVWFTLVLSEYCTLRSFGWDVSLTTAVVLCGAVGVAVSVPQAPSFVGVYQLAVQWTLTGLYRVPLQEAKAFAVAIWVTQIIPLGIIGFVCLRLLGAHLRETTRDDELPEPETSQSA